MKELKDILIPNQSPYFAMFTAGCYGYSIEKISKYCQDNGIPLRSKDIKNWESGYYKYSIKEQLTQSFNPVLTTIKDPTPLTFKDYKYLPFNWTGTDKRFFPCTKDNRPMQRWGWKITEGNLFDPNLMSAIDAQTLSPVGWIGQNMLYQTFIVFDIDGVGHGEVDEQVIAFGKQYKDRTLSFEDPKKKGSFHLYFKTNKIIPIKHFPHAKLDILGNASNAAVYFKNKISNNVPMLELTEDIWNDMNDYQESRKAKNNGNI